MMNVLYYDIDKIDFENLENVAQFVQKKLGDTIFLPTATHLLIDAPAEEIMNIMDRLVVVLEKIREERPDEYEKAKQMRQYEIFKKVIKANAEKFETK